MSSTQIAYNWLLEQQDVVDDIQYYLDKGDRATAEALVRWWIDYNTVSQTMAGLAYDLFKSAADSIDIVQILNNLEN